MKNKYIIVGSNNFWYQTGEGTAKDIEEELRHVKAHLSEYPASIPEKLYVYNATLVREEVCHV